MTDFTDLNDAFGKALLQQFFEPVLSGRGPAGEAYYTPSGVSLLAQELYRQQATKIMEEVWERIDVDDLATRIADKVIVDLTKNPGLYERRNVKQDELTQKVMEIAAQQLGQRVVDAMDLRIEKKESDADVEAESPQPNA